MSVSFRRMLPSDALAVCLQSEQMRLSPMVARAEYRDLLAQGRVAFTCHEGDTIHGCGGIVQQWDAPHLGRAWALVGSNVPMRAWHAITDFTRAVLDEALLDVPAVETEVDLCHRNGHRWAHILGFRLAGVRPHRNADTDMPAAFYTYTGKHEGVPVSVSAALDFLDRCVASWLNHAPGTDPRTVLKAAMPKPKIVRAA